MSTWLEVMTQFLPPIVPGVPLTIHSTQALIALFLCPIISGVPLTPLTNGVLPAEFLYPIISGVPPTAIELQNRTSSSCTPSIPGYLPHRRAMEGSDHWFLYPVIPGVPLTEKVRVEK